MSTKCFFSPFLFRHITEQALFHARGAEAEQLGNWAMVGSSSPWLMGYGLFIFGKKSFLPSSTLSRICFTSIDHKTVRPASSNSQNRSHNLPERFEGEVAAIFLFLFYFLF